MSIPLSVLILEDRSADAALMLHELRRAGFDPAWQRVETDADYLAQLHGDLDVILADYSLPQFDALRALRLLQERGLDIPFIIVSGTIGEELAVSAMKEGAADYLLKDRLARMGQVVAQALEQKQLREAKRQAEERYRAIFDNTVEGIFQITSNGRFITANRALARMLGYESPDALLTSLTDIERQLLIDPEHRAEFKRLLAEHGSVQNFETQICRKDGSAMWIALNARVVYGTSGTLLYYLLSQKFQKSGLRILSQPNGKGNRSIQRVNSTPKQPLSQWTGCCLRQLFRPQENDLEFLALSHWARH